MNTDFKSRVNICKAGILILGLVVLGVGLYSHFQSSWMKTISQGDAQSIWRYLKLYQICPLKPLYPDYQDNSCPSISLERYFVAIIVICFILSVLVFIAGIFINLEEHPLKLVDIGYHIVAAILLFIGAIVYIISANKIDTFFNFTDIDKETLGINMRKSEKILAAVITMFQAVLYGGVAGLIVLNRNTASTG